MFKGGIEIENILKGYYVRKTYIYDEGEVSKGLLDTFNPITESSQNYKHWVAQLDLRTCIECRSRHGKIYHMNEVVFDSPPLHDNCRCSILEMESIKAGNATKNGSDGADYCLKYYGELPDYYVSEDESKELGWKRGKPLVRYAPDKMITMGVYNNREGHLPKAIGRVWYEADINYYSGRRNMHRVLWSNDGLLFVTYDHYHTFYEII